MEDGVSGQHGHLVRYHAEEEVVVKIDLAITQHQLTEDRLALVLQITSWKNVALTNVQVIYICLRNIPTHAENLSYQ